MARTDVNESMSGNATALTRKCGYPTGIHFYKQVKKTINITMHNLKIE
jgi:hypothetical protein